MGRSGLTNYALAPPPHPHTGTPPAAPGTGEAGAMLHHTLHSYRALLTGGHALGHHPGAQASSLKYGWKQFCAMCKPMLNPH